MRTFAASGSPQAAALLEGRPRRSARQGPLGRNDGPRCMGTSASLMVRGDGGATQL